MNITPINKINFYSKLNMQTAPKIENSAQKDFKSNNSTNALLSMPYYAPFFKGIDDEYDNKPFELVDGKKAMENYCQKLKQVPSPKEGENSYLTIEQYCNIPLEAIEKQYLEIMGEEIELVDNSGTQKITIQKNKNKLLEFLKLISENPKKYSQNIKEMDLLGQGVEWVYPAIQEINRLKNGGCNVYITMDTPKNIEKKEQIEEAVRVAHLRCIHPFNLFELANVDAVSKKDAQQQVDDLTKKAKEALKGRFDNKMLNYCYKALDLADTYSIQAGQVYIFLAELDYILKRFDSALTNYNKAINAYCEGLGEKYFSKSPSNTLYALRKDAERYVFLRDWEISYQKNIKYYNNGSFLYRLAAKEPIPPEESSDLYEYEAIIYKDVETIMELFKKLSLTYKELANNATNEKKAQEYTEQAASCALAIKYIKESRDTGFDILKTRVGNQYHIGDILGFAETDFM